jgi:hypothetical protein
MSDDPATLADIALDRLLELQEAYREGRVHFAVTKPEIDTAEVRQWLAQCNAMIAKEIDAEIARRATFSEPRDISVLF